MNIYDYNMESRSKYTLSKLTMGRTFWWRQGNLVSIPETYKLFKVSQKKAENEEKEEGEQALASLINFDVLKKLKIGAELTPMKFTHCTNNCKFTFTFMPSTVCESLLFKFKDNHQIIEKKEDHSYMFVKYSKTFVNFS